MNEEGRQFPTLLSDECGTYQCRGWTIRGGDNDMGYRRYHDWRPVGYFNMALVVGGGPLEGGRYALGTRADRQYVVRACRNCPAIWHQDITDQPPVLPETT